MARISKRTVDAAQPGSKDFIVWDDDLAGFGLRVYASGRKSYVLQYRSKGRSRRFTIGNHGIWTPETARQEAKIRLGKIAGGADPAEEKLLDFNAITVKELVELYIKDMDDGVILGKGDRPKKPSTIATDKGRLRHHIVALMGSRRVKDITRPDVIMVMRDIMAGRTKKIEKSQKLRGKSIVRGGPGTARRTIGVLGGMLTYAVDLGIIQFNPVHGIRKPKGISRERRLTEAEYRILGGMLRDAPPDETMQTATEIIRQLALTGCRRSEIVKLKWNEFDGEGSCLRLADSKEGPSTRPIGLVVVEYLEARRRSSPGAYVFHGRDVNDPFGYFQTRWTQLFRGSPLEGITPHVLRHSFASVANDLGFTEITIASIIGHAKGSITGRYIHTLDTALVMAVDNISGYISGLLDGAVFQSNKYALDRESRKASLANFLREATGDAELPQVSLVA